jgi:hypothetical protein
VSTPLNLVLHILVHLAAFRSLVYEYDDRDYHKRVGALQNLYRLPRRSQKPVSAGEVTASLQIERCDANGTFRSASGT